MTTLMDGKAIKAKKSPFLKLFPQIMVCALPLLVVRKDNPLKPALLKNVAFYTCWWKYGNVIAIQCHLFLSFCVSSTEKLYIHNVLPNTQSGLKNKCFSSSGREF